MISQGALLTNHQGFCGDLCDMSPLMKIHLYSFTTEVLYVVFTGGLSIMFDLCVAILWAVNPSLAAS